MFFLNRIHPANWDSMLSRFLVVSFGTFAVRIILPDQGQQFHGGPFHSMSHHRSDHRTVARIPTWCCHCYYLKLPDQQVSTGFVHCCQPKCFLPHLCTASCHLHNIRTNNDIYSFLDSTSSKFCCVKYS